MYFVGEEAIADTDITQVSLVILYPVTDFMQSVGKVLVSDSYAPIKEKPEHPRVTNVDMLSLQ